MSAAVVPLRAGDLARVAVRTTFVLAVLAACGDAPPAESVEPVPPPRPEIPARWRTVASDEGDVRLVVPPDLVVFHTDGSVFGNREGDEAEQVIVAAVAPSQVRQPRGESPVEWANAGGWLTAGQGHVDPAEVRSRDVLLPAGPAIELTSSWGLGEAGPRWTMLHVIRTADGWGLLQVSGAGGAPDQPSEEVRLMRELVEFGD